MTTCTWNLRKRARPFAVLAASAGVTMGVVVPPASADQVSNLKGQAAAIQERITALGQQEDALSERFDQAQIQVSTLQAAVARASHQLETAQATASNAKAALKAEAVSAYVNGGGGTPLASDNSPVQNASNSLLRSEYVNTLAADQNDAIDAYRLTALREQAAETNLEQQSAAAKAEMHQLDTDRTKVEQVADQLTTVEKSVKGQIRTVLQQQQAAADAATQAKLLAQANTHGGSVSPSSVSAAASIKAVPVGSGVAGAIRAAESRVGDWYEWGAAGPTRFDCSGLVMWAYAQVGISLPHYSGAQYADTTHIPISQVQPGDLVFYSNPGQHVAMYVGDGDIVEAPHTGAQVHIVKLSSSFVLASRVG